jgi:hypothetical protein
MDNTVECKLQCQMRTSAGKEIKYHKRYSLVSTCLCKQLHTESKIVEADMLFISIKLKKKLLGSEGEHIFNADNNSCPFA